MSSAASSGSRPRAKLLLVLGGLLLVVGNALPELSVLLSNALHLGPSQALPGRSHWAVFLENVDILVNPDPFVPTPWTSILDYSLQACGLAWLALTGVLLVVAAPFERSRLAALLVVVFHCGAFLVLGGGALALRLGLPSDDADGATGGRLLTIGAVALLALALLEWLIGRRVRQRERRGGLAAVDLAAIVPVAFLLLGNLGLFVALRTHPNWPSAGYFVGAVGALLTVIGMARRRATNSTD